MMLTVLETPQGPNTVMLYCHLAYIQCLSPYDWHKCMHAEELVRVDGMVVLQGNLIGIVCKVGMRALRPLLLQQTSAAM